MWRIFRIITTSYIFVKKMSFRFIVIDKVITTWIKELLTMLHRELVTVHNISSGMYNSLMSNLFISA